MPFATADIRNLVLLGQAGAGKTLLAEALLHRAGAIRRMGELARGTTVCSTDPLEKELQHSVDTAVCHFASAGKHVNLIDTPGYPDLLGRSQAVLSAVETAAIVVNAERGIEIATSRMAQAAEARGLDRIVVVNRIDQRDTDLPQVLAELRATFGAECLPINLPADGGNRVVDCFFSRDGPRTDFDGVAAAHRRIVEQVVEVDAQLLERYLADDEGIDAEQLHEPFEQALREGHLIPVCFASALTGVGIGELLDLILRLMPSPLEANPPEFVKGEGAADIPVTVEPDAARSVLAHVFKVRVDPYQGRVGMLRVQQGTLAAGAQLFIGDARKPFKVAHVYRVQGAALTEIPRAVAGDICAVTKVEDLHFDAVVHGSHDEDHYRLRDTPQPPPMHGVAIAAARHGDEQKLADAFQQLLAEDPTLRIEHVAALNETVLYGHGELHLRVVLERLQRQHHVAVTTRPPGVPYRETVQRAAEGHCRHKKQTGGAGQFGEVFLRVEPRPRGSGFEFVDAVKGGAIPAAFIPAVEKGVRQVLATGAVAGYPLADLRVVVHDGKTHPVDSKEVAFVAAGRKAFLDALGQAQPVVLEPVVTIDILAPASAIGNIAADLAAMRARINDREVLPNRRAVIKALVPLVELENYAHRLKAQTSGEGLYTLEWSHYEPAPPKLQQELTAAFTRRAHEAHDD